MAKSLFSPRKVYHESEETWVDSDSGWLVADQGRNLCLLNPGTLQEYQLEGTFADALRDFLLGETNGENLELKSIQSLLPEGKADFFKILPSADFRRDPSLTEILSLDSPRQLWIEVQGSCNEECLHCYAESAPKDLPSLPPETVDSIVDDASRMGFSLIQFTGGDPLLWEHLPEMVQKTRDLDMDPEIYTNGLLLDDSLYEELAPGSPRYAFSLYSHEPDVHDSITQHPGSWNRTVRALDRALEGPTPVRVGVVIMKQNQGQEEEIADFLTQRGLDPNKINFSHTQNVGRGESISSTRNGPEGTGGPASDASSPSSAGNGHLTGERRSFNPGKLCVSYRGEVIPCIFQREFSLGSVHRRQLEEIVEHPRAHSTASSLQGNPNDPGRLSCPECRFHAFLLRYYSEDD